MFLTAPLLTHTRLAINLCCQLLPWIFVMSVIREPYELRGLCFHQILPLLSNCFSQKVRKNCISCGKNMAIKVIVFNCHLSPPGIFITRNVHLEVGVFISNNRFLSQLKKLFILLWTFLLQPWVLVNYVLQIALWVISAMMLQLTKPGAVVWGKRDFNT